MEMPRQIHHSLRPQLYPPLQLKQFMAWISKLLWCWQKQEEAARRANYVEHFDILKTFHQRISYYTHYHHIQYSTPQVTFIASFKHATCITFGMHMNQSLSELRSRIQYGAEY